MTQPRSCRGAPATDQCPHHPDCFPLPLRSTHIPQPNHQPVGSVVKPDPTSGRSGIPVSGFKYNVVFRNNILPPVPPDPRVRVSPPDDIAVISLAQPITVVRPVSLLTLQQGQPGFPTAGTTITMVGTGSGDGLITAGR